MAPKSGTKRGAPAKGTQPSKVQKKAEEPAKVQKKAEAPKDPLMEGLVNAVERAELPEACKEMLLLMIPGSFAAPVEERHELQTMAVSMVGEVIEQMHGQMTKDVQEANSALEAAEAKKTSLEAKVVEAESQLTTAGEAVQSKDAGLQDASKVEIEKQALFDAAKDAQTKGDADFEAIKEEKENYANAFANSFKMLCGSDLEGHEAVQHYKVIQPFIAKLALDESLILALPSTCQKKPCDRGSFDTVIMDQLEKAMQAHIATLEQKIEGGASAAAERAGARATAEEELKVAKGVKDSADEELRNAQAKRQEATDLLESSKKAVGDIKVELESLGKARDGKVTACTHFENWNLSCFVQLRDKSTAPKEVAPPQETAAPKEMLVEEPKAAPVIEAGA